MFRHPVTAVSLRPSCTTAALCMTMLWYAMCASELAAEAPADPQVKVVDVEGAGEDIEAAKKDACREAVRQVVGAYLHAKTHTENDELIEDKIISLSSGYVEKIETLNEYKKDGLMRVKLSATVRISKVLESLKANKISIVNVDGESLGARLVTTDDQRSGEVDVITAAFEGFPGKWFKVSIAGEPRLGERTGGPDAPVIVTVIIEPDIDGFKAAAAKLDEAFKAADRPNGSFEVDGAKCGFGSRFSQAKAGERLRSEFCDGSNTHLHPPLKALAFLDGERAFPYGLYDFASVSRSGGVRYQVQPGSKPIVVPQGSLPITFPVKFMGEDNRRSSWRWYGLTVDDAKKFFSSRMGKTLDVRTALVDSSGETIAADTWALECMGIGGMKYWSGYELETDGLKTVVIAPCAIPRRDVTFLVPKFSCERTFLVSKDELGKVAKATVEIE
jgi:hypothetical protein